MHFKNSVTGESFVKAVDRKFATTLLLSKNYSKAIQWSCLKPINCCLSIFLMEATCLIGSILYAIRHLDDFSKVLYVFFQISALSGAIVIFVTSIILRRECIALIEKIQNIYDSSKKLKLGFLSNSIRNHQLANVNSENNSLQIEMRIFENC